jgi:membrane associated rhomboid family serine protease
MPAGDPAGVPTCYRHRDRETYISCQRCGKPICPDCMRDAAVGFHCPDCIAEGRRTTRQARTAFGGLRTGDYGLVSKTLIGINAAVWLLILATGANSSPLVERLSLIPKGQCGDGQGRWVGGITTRAQCQAIGQGHAVHWVSGVATGAPWQMVTSLFTHVELFHIGFNMVALWFLGPQLEMVLGRVRFIALYLLSGLVGSVGVYWLSDQSTPTLGASGAIFGLMAALLVVARKAHADVSQLLVWIGINAALTFFASGISWQGHVGGFVGGLVLAGVLVYSPRENRTAWQAAGFAAVSVLVVLAFVVRTAALR